ncbi:hypothetical protein ACROYT_G013615 [Oculina patagonica]
MHETSYNPTQISLVTRQLHSAIVADKESMAYFLLLTICVLLHFDTTSSLQASTVRELSGLYSNTKHYVSAVNFNGSAADPSFQNVSQACQNAILGLKNSSRVAAKYIDASGRPNSGVSSGNLVWLGSYATCKTIPDAQYCLSTDVTIVIFTGGKKPKVIPYVEWGLCVPAACSEEDVSYGFGDIVKGKLKMAEQLPVFKKPKRDRNRFTLQFEAPLEESSRIEALKDRVKGCKLRWQVENNTEWLERVLDVVEMMQSSPASPLSQPSSPTPSPFLAPVTPPQVRYFSSRFSPGSSPIPSPSPPGSISSPVAVTPPSGQQRVEIHTPVEEDDGSYFVASTATVRRLLKSVTESNGNCPSCHGVLLLETTEMQRRVSVRCQRNHEVVWFSSPITNSKFLINLRMIHGFLSSGLTETQYRGFMEAASLGSVEHTYLDTVVNKLGYSASVTEMYENSLAQARMKVQRSADYMAQNGDAEPAIVPLCRNKRVIGTVNWSKKDLASAQSREVPMTKELIHQLEAKGHRVVEVAHDAVESIRKWLLEEKGIKNSFDSWHGNRTFGNIDLYLFSTPVNPSN